MGTFCELVILVEVVGSTAQVGGEVLESWSFCFSADHLKNASRADLLLVARSRALIAIKSESRLLLSRDAPRRAGGGGARGRGSRAASVLL